MCVGYNLNSIIYIRIIFHQKKQHIKTNTQHFLIYVWQCVLNGTLPFCFYCTYLLVANMMEGWKVINHFFCNGWKDYSTISPTFFVFDGRCKSGHTDI